MSQTRGKVSDEHRMKKRYRAIKKKKLMKKYPQKSLCEQTGIKGLRQDS